MVGFRENRCMSLMERMKTHPFLWTALVSFLAAAVFIGGTDWRLAPQGMLLLVMAVILLLVWYLERMFRQAKSCGVKEILSSILLSGAALAFLWLLVEAEQNVVLLFIGGLIVAGLYLWEQFRAGKLTTEKIILLLFVLSFLLRLCYILYTSIYTRQHDTENWGGQGHLGYMEYLYQNKSFYNGDVRDAWQFYHPPFHHILGTIWLSFLTAVGLDMQGAAGEGLQFLTLFYASCCILVSYKLLRHFRLRGNALVIAFAIVAFHPTFIILSGSVNNDILSIALMLGAILCTAQWYRKPTLGKILQLALCIGLGMMTKLSVWMVAPATALVFLAVLIRDRKKWAARIGQMAAFGVVCVPLGLWWELRNYLLHRVPFTYVPALPENNWQYIGQHSVTKRLFDFSLFHFESPYQEFLVEESYNPTIGLLKTAMFDEGRYEGLDWIAQPLFWLGTILALAGFAALVFFLVCKTRGISPVMRLFFGVLTAVVLVSYYIFCIEFDQICTQNIRYAVPLITVGALSIGLLLQRLRRRKTIVGRAVKIGFTAVTAAYCFCSAMMYIGVGFCR